MKLTVLYQLSRVRELPATELARRVMVAPDWLSNHLTRLTSVGLVRRRRSGAYIFYRLAGDDEGSGFAPASLVRRALLNARWATRGWDEKEVVHLSARTMATVGRSVLRVFDVIFDAATAFGNVRRLQILRLLMQRGACSASSVVHELKISPAACCRHLDKLVRRGYVSRRGREAWALSKEPRSRFHAELLALVVSGLGA